MRHRCGTNTDCDRKHSLDIFDSLLLSWFGSFSLQNMKSLISRSSLDKFTMEGSVEEDPPVFVDLKASFEGSFQVNANRVFAHYIEFLPYCVKKAQWTFKFTFIAAE